MDFWELVALVMSSKATPEKIADAVSTWLNQHVDPETGYVIDDSLTISGAAADAKAVGDILLKLTTEEVIS